MKYLKIAIMNNSGNVGKSMMCDNLFAPRISGAKKIKIESINSDLSNDEVISAKDIKNLFISIDSANLAIIDVGSSNIEIFMSNLRMLEGSHDEIDFFFIPTTPDKKQQLDTISTVNDLLDLGVQPDQIKLIFNYCDPETEMIEQYLTIFDSSLFKVLKLKDDKNIFSISKSLVFDHADQIGLTFDEIVNDKTDFKALMRATEDPKDRAYLSQKRTSFRFAQNFLKELDNAFYKINKACAFDKM